MNAKLTVWLMAALMCGAALAGMVRPEVVDVPDFLEETVPETFGGWHKVDAGAKVIDPATAELLKKIYKEVLTRTYEHDSGHRIMLSIARSANQIGVQAAHLPDVCYPAQGFELLGEPDRAGLLSTRFGAIEVTRLKTRMGLRDEPVTYWLTMTDRVVRTRWDKRIVQLIALLTSQAPGGLLFRVSSIDADAARAFAIQEQFVADLMASVPAEGRRKLAGLAPQP